MKKIENEFIEKQKITVELEKRKAIESQEKALGDQQKKYEKELEQDKKKIAELETWKKQAQEQKNKEVVKFQDQIDALEDKEYKKTLDDTKDTIQQEKDKIKEEDKKKKTIEYVNSFSQSGASDSHEKESAASSSSQSQADIDETDRIIQENIKNVGDADNNDAQNANEKLYHDDIQY